MGSSSILIVDDQANIRTSVRHCLEAVGYRVHEASNGSEAMQRIMHDAPDLMLLDLAMPVVDGMAVLAQMRSLWARPPTLVIVTTAHGSIKTAVRAMQLGASDASVLQARDAAADFLEKPTTPEQLRQSVHPALEEQHASAARRPPAAAGRPSHANVTYSETLVRLQQAVWKSDINLTEQILADCLHKAGADPTFYNVVGVVFEAQGNLQTAKTFYQKAQAIPGGYEPASQNLQRLELIEMSGSAQCDVALGAHARLIDDICDQSHVFGSLPPTSTARAARDQETEAAVSIHEPRAGRT